MAADLASDCKGKQTKKENLRIASLNARGLGDKHKRNAVALWFNKQNIDILCCQETYCITDNEKSFYNSFSPFADEVKHSFTDSTHSRGTAIITRKGSNIDIDNICRKENGRQIIINARYNLQNITIVNLYAPSIMKERIAFFKRISTWIKQNIDESNTLIICGDFNSVTSEKDRTTGKVDKCGHHFNNLKKNLSLIDSYRYLNPDEHGFTWVDPADVTKMSRLDYIFTTHYMEHNIKQSFVSNAPVPDHKAVVTDFSINNRARGPGYWKLNVSVLNDEQYKEKVKTIYNKTVEDFADVESKRVIWDLFKIRVKEFSIRYCIEKKSREHDELENLNSKINIIDDEITRNPQNSSQLIRERSEAKNKLNMLSLNEAKGYQIRSRVRWLEEGEKNTKYFARLENRRQTFNYIQCLKKQGDEDNTAESDKDIIEEITYFYQSLYKSKRPNRNLVMNYLNDTQIMHTLGEIDREMCDQNISVNECKSVLKHMKNNKSPGLDGLPIEFYKTFWDLISDFLLEVYNESLINGELSYSQRTAIMSPIFKKNDRRYLKNYRPISLTTSDYKILAFVLARRLQRVLDKIISTTQGAYVKKRFIGCNIRLIEDLIDYADKLNDDSMILFLDFEKAFDTVEWNFMYETLKRFNFGNTFIRWVETLYTNAKIRVKNNGWISEDISVERGIRQGCPVSALLFILVVEILAINIKMNENIRGLEVQTHNEKRQVKISQYADDGHVLLYDMASLDNTLHTITEFTKMAGPKLNLDKCELIPLKGEIVEHPNIKSVKNAKCLGIWVGKDKHINDDKNWNEKVEKIKKSLQIWKTRNLTLFGKTTIIKMLGMPKATYSATNTSIPKDAISSLDTVFYDFLWQGRDKIKRTEIIGNILEGGIAMTDTLSFFEALKAAWIIRYFQSIEVNSQWSVLMKYYIDSFGKNNIILHMTFRNEKEFPYMNTITPFYREVITAFNKVKQPVKPCNENDLLNTMIWGNRYLTYKGKRNKMITLYSKEWIDSNIIFINNLLITNGTISVDYIHNKLTYKGNIFRDMTRLNTALSIYKNILHNNIPNDLVYTLPSMPSIEIDNEQLGIMGRKSNFFYKHLLRNRVTTSDLTHYFGQNTIIENIPEVRKICMSKIIDIIENKIKEFNYKLLKKIGACGKLLSKWNTNFKVECDVCNAEETQVHIITECPQTKAIWEKIKEKLGLEILDTYTIIFGMQKKPLLNNLISQISYSIHKYWVIRKNENKQYSKQDLENIIKQDLLYKHRLFTVANYAQVATIYEQTASWI